MEILQAILGGMATGLILNILFILPKVVDVLNTLDKYLKWRMKDEVSSR